MENINASSESLKEALLLSEKILEEIELSTIPLTNIALKSSRLARLIGHFDYQQIFLYEVSGYPSTPDGVSSKIWAYTKMAGRILEEKEGGEIKEYAKIESIEQLTYDLEAAQESLMAAKDADVSITSANPHQYVQLPKGNKQERVALRKSIRTKSKILAQRRSFIHNYVSSIYYELKYSSITNDIFARIREKVDRKIGDIVPSAIKKFSAVYENLVSDNSEDWSNAVHSCRRILQDLADVIYPPCEDKATKVNGKDKMVKLGTENYINRIIAFVEENSTSARFEEIVGSHLKYLGERLDSIFQAAQKGSHKVISSQNEADRYAIFTYLVVGDILELKEKIEHSKAKV